MKGVFWGLAGGGGGSGSGGAAGTAGGATAGTAIDRGGRAAAQRAKQDNATLRAGTYSPKRPNDNQRVAAVIGKTVAEAFQTTVTIRGVRKEYQMGDLIYDLDHGYVKLDGWDRAPEGPKKKQYLQKCHQCAACAAKNNCDCERWEQAALPAAGAAGGARGVDADAGAGAGAAAAAGGGGANTPPPASLRPSRKSKPSPITSDGSSSDDNTRAAKKPKAKKAEGAAELALRSAGLNPNDQRVKGQLHAPEMDPAAVAAIVGNAGERDFAQALVGSDKQVLLNTALLLNDTAASANSGTGAVQALQSQVEAHPQQAARLEAEVDNLEESLARIASGGAEGWSTGLKPKQERVLGFLRQQRTALRTEQQKGERALQMALCASAHTTGLSLQLRRNAEAHALTLLLAVVTLVQVATDAQTRSQSYLSTLADSASDALRQHEANVAPGAMPSVHKDLKDKHAEVSNELQANERGLQAEADYVNRLLDALEAGSSRALLSAFIGEAREQQLWAGAEAGGPLGEAVARMRAIEATMPAAAALPPPAAPPPAPTPTPTPAALLEVLAPARSWKFW
jgi:hypothetical protein